MRVGKTPSAIRLACSRAKTALVICPKSLVTQWQREIETWREGDCEFYVYSKEQFKKHVKEIKGCEAVIIDESHLAFSNFKNQMFKTLISYIKVHDPKFIWLLTGTPYTSSSWSIYSYGLLLGKAWNWYKWNRHFFYQVRMGHRVVPQPREDRDKELQDIIRSLGIVIDLKDVADVPDDEETLEYFSLGAEQKRLIKENFDPLPIVRFTKEHQLEQGVLKSDGYTDTVSFSTEKDTRIKELVEQTEKVIIVCRYLDQITKLKELLTPTGRKVYEISGRVKETAGDIAMRAETDPSAIVIVQSATGVGYSLKSFDTMIFASMDFSYVNYEQMRSRMKAMEKTAGCTYIHLLTEGDSIDQAVYDAVKEKRDFSIELFKKK